MYKFKGFASIRQLVSNTDRTVAAVGELSAICATYAKDVKIYGGVTPGVQIHGFSSKLAGEDVIAPDLAVVSSVSLVEWVVRRQSALVQTDTTNDFRLAIASEFTGFSSFEVGELVRASDDKLYPSYVTWKINDLTDDNLITVYFSNAAFETLYDDYTIDIIPPLPTLDAFFDVYERAAGTIQAITYMDTLQRIQDRRARYPETVLTGERYDFYNSNDATVKTSTNWTFLVYGPRGNDPDALKQALVSYIAQNSNRQESQWRVIFPDIFRTTEFVITPLWANMSVHEMTINQGVYSPIVRLKEDAVTVKNLLGLSAQEDTHFSNYACVFPRPYRSISCVCVGSTENRPTQMHISDIYPDLINVASTSLDFGRMSQATQNFAVLLDDMIYRAEQYTDRTTLPSVYRISTRNGKKFITVTEGGIKYLVMVRQSALS